MASAFLQYAAKLGEEERTKAEESIVKQLVNIQSGYPVFHKFADEEKAVVVQSPCDGLAKAIQRYRRNFNATKENFNVLLKTIAKVDTQSEPASDAPATTSQTASRIAACSKCGTQDWLKIDGCQVCQGCGYSKCG